MTRWKNYIHLGRRHPRFWSPGLQSAKPIGISGTRLYASYRYLVSVLNTSYGIFLGHCYLMSVSYTVYIGIINSYWFLLSFPCTVYDSVLFIDALCRIHVQNMALWNLLLINNAFIYDTCMWLYTFYYYSMMGSLTILVTTRDSRGSSSIQNDKVCVAMVILWYCILYSCVGFFWFLFVIGNVVHINHSICTVV